jgi:hypothetical protein
VKLGDAQGLIAKAFKTTRRHLARLQSTRRLVVRTSQGPLPRRVLDRLLRGPSELLDLGYTVQGGVERKATRGLVLG